MQSRVKTDNPVDQSHGYVVAFDFDCTITTGHGKWPHPDPIRPHMARLIKYLRRCGIYCVLFTCRVTEGLQLAKDALDEAGVVLDGYNDSFHLCPFSARPDKVYAHAYVDDRNTGWHRYGFGTGGEFEEWCAINHLLKDILASIMPDMDMRLEEDIVNGFLFDRHGKELTDDEFEQISNRLYGRR